MKRTFKLNGEVSPEANDMLVAYCKKHERSKGYLLEKMIRKFCVVDVEPKTQIAAVKEAVKRSTRFKPPAFSEVDLYMISKGVSDQNEAAKFCDFYESNGWKVGKNKMKCWKAAVRNWLKGNNNGQSQKSSQKLSAHERVVERNNAKYRQSNECGLGMGTNDGHLGRAVDEGERGATIEHMDSGTFIDYE